jgi:hypothetical protein
MTIQARRAKSSKLRLSPAKIELTADLLAVGLKPSNEAIDKFMRTKKRSRR